MYVYVICMFTTKSPRHNQFCVSSWLQTFLLTHQKPVYLYISNCVCVRHSFLISTSSQLYILGSAQIDLQSVLKSTLVTTLHSIVVTTSEVCGVLYSLRHRDCMQGLVVSRYVWYFQAICSYQLLTPFKCVCVRVHACVCVFYQKTYKLYSCSAIFSCEITFLKPDV